MPAIGPNFSQELKEAGLSGLPFAWGSDGKIDGRENLTTEQNVTLDAVIAAHVPPTSFELLVDAKRAAVRRKRNELETGGFQYNGESMLTDDAGQARLDKALRLANAAGPPAALDFEAQHGVWETFTPAEIKTISKNFGIFIQALNAHARALDEALTVAADEAELDAIDIETGWPGQS